MGFWASHKNEKHLCLGCFLGFKILKFFGLGWKIMLLCWHPDGKAIVVGLEGRGPLRGTKSAVAHGFKFEGTPKIFVT